MTTSWLDPIARALERGEDVLVLCRTSASVRGVLRTLGTHGRSGGARGFAGLEVSTLRGYVHARLPAELVPGPLADDELPAKHVWTQLLAGRPRLRALLRRHLERAHLSSAAGVSLEALSAPLRALVAAGWSRTPLATHAARILAAPPPPVVFSVGFGAPGSTGLGSIGPFERATLAALGAVALEAPPCRAAAPVRARRLPDVAAEARAIVATILSRPELRPDRVLVLVSDSASESASARPPA
ncbi:MAG: hypothetical protein IPN34_27570 [Planctomycetes bacterium]|nr:hypothetical protein [Planctomycetota bacterium]